MLTDETISASNVSSSPTKTPTITAVEIQQFIAYLLRVVPLATDLNVPSDVDELKRALNEKASSTDSIRRFLSDPQCAILLVRVLQQGKGNERDASFPETSASRILEDEHDSVEAADANGIQFEFSTEATYIAQRGIR